MLKRTLSATTLLIILFCAIFFGKIYGVIALATIASTLALFEFYRLMDHCGAKPRKAIGLLIGILFIPTIFYGAAQGNFTTNTEIAMLVPAAIIIICGICLMRSREIPEIVKQLSTGIGVLYIPFMVSFFALLVGIYGMNGVWFCAWIVLTTKFTDVGGLLGGKFFGKRKLAPTISPHKTWEGVIGGLILSMVVGAGVAALFNCAGVWEPEIVVMGVAKVVPPDFAFSPLTGAVCAIPLAIVCVVSDLVESVVKRNAGDKDSGSTIPGMGGALDLLDSLLLVAPVGFVVVHHVILR
ncbi:MAG: phosphatidate cytidylyltransferase [Opitutae bacterium]|nr:phosphatidate cytidylyltransferase [Opitutae bacterium]